MAKGDVTRTAPMVCPGCGSPQTGRLEAGQLEQAEHVDGDVGVCFYCSALSVYVGTPAHSMRAPTPEEERELRADPEIRRMLNDLVLFRMANGL